MSQRIAIDCDIHLLRDETVPGQPLDVAIRVPGGAFRAFTIDVCEACAKPLQDVFAEVAEAGRPFDGDLAKAIGSQKTAGRKPNPGDHVCPHCGRTYATRESLGTHLRGQHNSGLTQEFGMNPRPDDKECPECGQKFTPQGLASHLRGHRRASREAAADG